MSDATEVAAAMPTPPAIAPSAPLPPTLVKGRPRRLHPLPIRIMHWINAVTIFIMVGSGWKIYDDDAIFGWFHFPDYLTIGRWAQHGLQWHFFGMWLLVINGLAYLSYGLFTGRYARMLLPIRWPDVMATVSDSLHFRLAHDDATQYNAVQKILYIGVILVGMLIVASGLAIWKPIQFHGLLELFGGFQAARLVHFLCMSAIVGFVAIHVLLAILVPKTIVAMLFGGPVVPEPGHQHVEPAEPLSPNSAA